MISPDTIWAVGEGGVLLHSTNGRTNWSVDYSADGWHLYKLFFTSSETGFVSGTGQINKTINGGKHWYSSYHSGYDEIRDIQFINDSIGWACGEDGMMLSTENGGFHWNESHLPYSQTLHIQKYAFGPQSSVLGPRSSFMIFTDVNMMKS